MPYPKFRPLLYGAEAAQLERERALQAEASGVPTYRQTIPSILVELRRCRRYEHPLAVLVMGLYPVKRAAQTNGNPVKSDLVMFLLLGSMLQDVTRETDIVTYAAQDHVYALFLPEADETAAMRAARRVASAFYDRTAARLRAAVAVFPGHGLIVDALYDHAMSSYAQAASVPIDAEPMEDEDAWRYVRWAR